MTPVGACHSFVHSAHNIYINIYINIQMRAARELEDLRLEQESLQVMKQQLAAVHKLRIDLQRKDSVIQASQAARRLFFSCSC